ncbi:acetylornithine transaminase [Amphritea japonica]|uniref:Acetylornithine/N-succinyldiaminopimelate aminotransferase n=1 Tax=Amphritea japonica ATCC BAA-1530 TaxID=1278309 RepID=A0A7R6P7M4_9GAMM|nr:acetylornithine transaminase [Amphritea japonica]BBB24937.1 acetylornithine/N-succinyldiaminopimelate aminotransferase [Amphritea japonica ATCC BAA-1530]
MKSISENSLLAKQNYLIPITKRPEICFVRGEGDYLYDQNDKRYLDWIQGWAVNTLGHSPQVMQKTLMHQAALLINPGPAFYNQPMLELAELLCENSKFDEVFFTNSGAEANEGAIKLARKWGQKNKQGAFKVITFDHSFHGRTLATMSATGKKTFAPLFEPKVSGFTKVAYNDLTATEAAIDDQTVAIMLELIQGEAGVIPADLAFVAGLNTLCRKHNLLLIADEVQTGIGRTGNLFAYQQFQAEPHIMTLGKGLGGGVPIAAMMIGKAVSCFDHGDQGGTYNGNPLMCAVSAAVVQEVLAEGFLNQVHRVSRYFCKQLELLTEEFELGAIRGEGLLLAINTGQFSAPSIVEHAREAGLLLNAPRDDSLRFMPALTLTEERVDEGIALLAEVLRTIQGDD